MKFKISQEVLEKFPNLIVYIPLIYGFDNTKGREESIKLMRECENSLRKDFHSVEEIIKDPRIASYFDVFKKFGANPLKTKPTHFALAKRVLEGKELPDINPLVNIYNALSIKYLTPFGGEDLNTLYGDFVLDFSDGNEHWKGINEEFGKNPPKGSLIWKDDFDVSTVALNWRQCERTKLSETSVSGYFIMDGFADINESNIQTASKEFVDIVTKIAGGEGQILVLSKDSPFISIDFESKTIDGITLPTVDLVKKDRNKSVNKKESRGYVYEIGTPELLIQTLLTEALTIEKEKVIVSQTSNPKFGDYTSPIAMSLASILKDSPINIAKKIASEITLPNEFEKVEAVMPGYINFYLSKNYLKESLLNIDESFGNFKEGVGKKIMVEYGQPNTHKSITVGHVKSAITGLSVARLFETMGYEVIHANYFGDIGPYVAKTLYALLLTSQNINNTDHLNDEIVDNCLKYLNNVEEKEGLMGLQDKIGELYVLGSKFDKEDKQASEVIRNINSLLFNPTNEYLTRLYKETKDLCIKTQDEFFGILGVKYDRQYTESEVFELGKKIVEDNIGNIFIKDQGAVIFPGEKYKMSRFVFLTSDGNPTYSGKDLGLVNLKYQEYPDLDDSIILTSIEQNEYFKVLMKVISLLYPEREGKYRHIGFGWLLLNNKRTSSRGGSITFSEMYRQALESAKNKISEMKQYSEDEVEKISKSVALAGIKFNILSHEFYKDINYDPASFTSLNGFSAPYIMYSYTRAKSVLEKALEMKEFDIEKSLNEIVEIDLIRKLMEFPNKISISAKGLSTHLLCEYLYELANVFNNFYTTQSILNEENENIKNARLKLVEKTALVIKKGLYILGIEVIDRM